MESAGFYSQFYGSRMPRWAAKKYAAKMARLYGLPPPSVQWARLGKGGFTAEQQGSTIRVNIDKAQWTPMLLAHEMAHYVVETLSKDRPQPHGPKWLGVYVWLLDACCIVPKAVMVPYAKSFKLKILHPDQCGPDHFKAKR